VAVALMVPTKVIVVMMIAHDVMMMTVTAVMMGFIIVIDSPCLM
jgi:hypothetical protein